MAKATMRSALTTMAAMAKRPVDPPKVKKIEPTPEREARNHFRSAGMARKLVPVIDTLRNKGAKEEEDGIPKEERQGLTQSEWEALNYYRDQASLADKSPVRSCCDNSPRGGHGPGVAIISALIETGRLERDMGQLMDIARAVAVDDVSLSEWAIAKHGGTERWGKDKKGEDIVIAIIPRGRNSIAMARMELRMAAHRILRRA